MTYLKNDGSLVKTAKELGISVTQFKKRAAESLDVMSAMDEFREILLDEAVSALRTQIAEGNTRLIEFTLDRLGKDRGFVKQGVNDTLSVKGDVDVNHTMDLSKLSMEERILLMKASKRHLAEETVDAEVLP